MAQEDSSKKMGFFDHIEELRARLFRVVVVFFVGFGICYTYIDAWVMAWLRKPLFEVMPPEQQKLYFTSLFENFMTHLKIAGYTSIFLISPYLFFQIWGFISPGLYPREKKWVTPFILAATFFFVSGAAFAYYVMFPVAFKFFVTYGDPTDVPMLTIANYYDTCLKLLLLFGLAFELPVLIILLGLIGIVDAAALRAQRKFAVIGITVGCAMFAPPDAISMMILMAPLLLMYEGSILVVAMIGKKRKEAAQHGDGPPENPLSGRSR